MSEDELEEEEQVFDPAALRFDELVPFLFDRPILKDIDAREAEYYGKTQWAPSEDPVTLTANAARIFRAVPELRNQYTTAQINQGLWELTCAWIDHYLFNPEVPADITIDCLEAAYEMHAAVAPGWPEEDIGTFWMLWDFFASQAQRHYPVLEHVQRLCDLVGGQVSDAGRKFMLDQAKAAPAPTEAHLRCENHMFEVLCRMLPLPAPCPKHALHGLGHMHRDPQRRAEVVQAYIDQVRDRTTPEELAWMEGCRDGTAL